MKKTTRPTIAYFSSYNNVPMIVAMSSVFVVIFTMIFSAPANVSLARGHAASAGFVVASYVVMAVFLAVFIASAIKAMMNSTAVKRAFPAEYKAFKSLGHHDIGTAIANTKTPTDVLAARAAAESQFASVLSR
jgi:hypothetical protein